MNSSLWLPFTFTALGIAIVGAWSQPSNGIATGYSRWLPPYLIALICGFAGHFLQAPAALGVAALYAVSYYGAKPTLSRSARLALFALTLVLSLALALHLFPGFRNPLLVENVRFSASSAPFTQYANFDKASVGLVLMLFFCPRVSTVRELGQVVRSALPVTITLVIAVLGLSLAVGLTRVDVKLPAFTATFLITNLLFTCVAEEAFFRGLIQTRLSSALSTTRFGEAFAIGCSGVMFGAVHFAGGIQYTLMATLAGLGYAYVYSRTKRIEASICAHFLVNAFHFVLLTYPQAA